jgi:type I restriction enzyme S subunit
VHVKADVLYREIGIRSHGKGVFHKNPVSGLELGSKKVFRVEPGDFVLNIVFAWEGAVAVLNDADEGMIGSHRFPTFRADEARLDCHFLLAYLRMPEGIDLLGLVSPGGAGRNRTLSRTAFLQQDIPLPPLTEQQRIVALIKEVTLQVVEASNLRREAVNEIALMYRSILLSDRNAHSKPMSALVKLRKPDILVRAEEVYQFAGVYCFGRGVFKGQAKSGMEFAYPRLTRIRSGNFVYPKLMAWEGALGIVPPECDGFVVSTEFPVFDVIEEQVLPEVLDVYFRNPSIWPALSGASTGTNVRRRRLNPVDFLRYEFPVPSKPVQFELRRVLSETAPLRALQSETAAEIDALVPSVLQKAFAAGM